MINYIIENTAKFLEEKSKAERKKIGQFFTSKEIAMYMASLFKLNENRETVYILDPGAGSGILTAALIDRLQDSRILKEIFITCYENNADILPVLKKNAEYLKENSKIHLNIEIVEKNYILEQKTYFQNNDLNAKKYDMIIGNPPYMKISKNAPEALAMSSVCYGAPNLYFLFASISIFNLNDKGELVYIIPRSWTSGAYFKKFREYMLRETHISNLHLFVSRDKVFDTEQVLQETMIVKLVKEKDKKDDITISTSNSNKDYDNILSFKASYDVVVQNKNNFIYLITTKKEKNVIDTIHFFAYTLEDIGLKMKTGLTVDFRNKELLRCKEDKGIVPLFYSQHIKNGIVTFPMGREFEYISNERRGLIQQNKNYVFVKRFTSKEEKRRLQCGIYLRSDYEQYQEISTQNKLNFIDTLDGTAMSEDITYGLFVLFNSSIYDQYYRILNGSTQVNSTEVNSIPIPCQKEIIGLGKKIKNTKDLSTKNCDLLLQELL